MASASSSLALAGSRFMICACLVTCSVCLAYGLLPVTNTASSWNMIRYFSDYSHGKLETQVFGVLKRK